MRSDTAKRPSMMPPVASPRMRVPGLPQQRGVRRLRQARGEHRRLRVPEQSGKEAALLPPPPLRTGRASFPASGSSLSNASPGLGNTRPCQDGAGARNPLVFSLGRPLERGGLAPHGSTPAQRLNAIKAFRRFLFGIEAAKENARSFKAFMAKIKPTEYRKEDAETAARWVAVGFREWAIGGSQTPTSWYENCGPCKASVPGGIRNFNAKWNADEI
jgi:hypothetical protein